MLQCNHFALEEKLQKIILFNNATLRDYLTRKTTMILLAKIEVPQNDSFLRQFFEMGHLYRCK
jgi:hypothetical protein